MRDGLTFSGIMPANILPFRADLAIDEPAYRKHLRWLADTPGVTGIVANGHAAEVASLSREERRRALGEQEDVRVDAVGRRLAEAQDAQRHPRVLGRDRQVHGGPVAGPLPPGGGGLIPAAALSAYAGAADRRSALLAGFQHHVAKPVDPARLLAVIATLARKSAGGSF